MTRNKAFAYLNNCIAKGIISARGEVTSFSLSRREFLSLAAKAAFAASSFSSIRSFASSGNPKPSIVIIGAGIAGLTAAYELEKLGIKSTIYEGSTRAGGRIQTIYNQFDTLTYSENGGEFVDSTHSTIQRLCNENGVPLIDLQEDSEINHLRLQDYVIDGNNYSEVSILKEFTKASRIIATDLESCGSSYNTSRCIALDNTSLAIYINQLPMKQWLRKILIAAYEAEFGLPCTEQSSLNLIDMISSTLTRVEVFGDSDERYKVEGGSQRLVNAISRRISTPIEYNKTLVSAVSSNGSVEIGFKDGTRVKTEHLILAIPFSTLRHLKLDLEGMTQTKSNCIQTLGYGRNCKIILSTRSRGWRLDGSAGYLINNLIQNGWDSTQCQTGNTGPGSYTIYLGAPATDSPNISHSVNLKDLRDKFITIIKALYPSTVDDFTGRFRLVTWADRPLARGSYPCYKVGQWTTIAGSEAAQVGKVYFAGDHTSDRFQGYMNGAAESGVRVANEVAQAIRLADRIS